MHGVSRLFRPLPIVAAFRELVYQLSAALTTKLRLSIFLCVVVLIQSRFVQITLSFMAGEYHANPRPLLADADILLNGGFPFCQRSFADSDSSGP